MWWNVFDRWGNKVGEIHERDSDPGGCGCLLSSIGLLIIGVGAILIWPVVLRGLAKQDDAYIGAVQILALIITSIIHGKRLRYAENYSFIGAWICLIVSSTIVSGVVGWIISGLNFMMLFASLFICFLLAIGSGLVTAIVIAYLRNND